jgi:hypothetical protein
MENTSTPLSISFIISTYKLPPIYNREIIDLSVEAIASML